MMHMEIRNTQTQQEEVIYPDINLFAFEWDNIILRLDLFAHLCGMEPARQMEGPFHASEIADDNTNACKLQHT